MHVFVTGATGWIGSAVVDELLGNGYAVTGLARSDASAAALAAKGARVLRGDLDDLAGIRAGADATDATIHLANKHDFANPAVSNAAERGATEAIGSTLAGSGRRFLLASGLAGAASGRPLTEDDPSPHHGPDSLRGGSENLALSFAEQGVHPVAVRFAPTVHGIGDHGFVAAIVEAARRNGVSGYPGAGDNRWAAVHVTDAARLVRLALERAPAGARVHAAAEVGVSSLDIATAIGAFLSLPVASVATERLGWIGAFFSREMTGASDATRALLGWKPVGPSLLADIAAGAYGHGKR